MAKRNGGTKKASTKPAPQSLRLIDCEIPRPEAKEVKATAFGSNGKFSIGDSPILYHRNDSSHLMRVEVVSGYGVHDVTDGEGKSVRRAGYIVKVPGEAQQTFVAPYMLRDYAHRPAHLQLVARQRKSGEG